MWLDEDIKNTPKDGFVPPPPARLEFAHLHQDGSIHFRLSEQDIEVVLDTKCGEPHPYKKYGVNEILVYALQSKEEMKVLKQVIVASYGYLTNETIFHQSLKHLITSND
jgi:predicted DNA binding CopG/RHH family protein